MSISLFSPATAESITTFDDIQYWTGTGDFKSALVIDWDGASSTDEALVWGFRWDDEATVTSLDMLLAVLAEDDRFYAKLNSLGPQSVLLFGLGYDANNNGAFETSPASKFEADGISLSGIPDDPPPAASSADANDFYAEGWFTGFWNFGIASGGSPYTEGTWVGSNAGLSTRNLSDGSWDSWTFTPTFDFFAFAENPQAALPPAALAADFDGNGTVDGSDFLAWQNGFGITTGATNAQGDANADGAVDGSDFLVWQNEFGTGGSGGNASGITTIPEPSAGLLCIVFVVSCLCHWKEN